MIALLLTPLCSTEVQTLLVRLREKPQEFKYGCALRNIVDARGFTYIEQRAINAAWKAHCRTQVRRELLNSITSELLNPTAKYK